MHTFSAFIRIIVAFRLYSQSPFLNESVPSKIKQALRSTLREFSLGARELKSTKIKKVEVVRREKVAKISRTRNLEMIETRAEGDERIARTQKCKCGQDLVFFFLDSLELKK